MRSTKPLFRPAWMLTCLAACVLAAVRADASPPRGSVAPAINLRDLNGEAVSTAKLAPRALVLVFGELNHEGVRQACGDVMDVLTDPRLAGGLAVPILLVAQDAPAAQLKEHAAPGRYPAVILQDPKRDAFGAYRVLVIPTIVVVDGKGKVVYSFPAYQAKSRDLLREAVLTAAGKQTPERFEQSLDPKASSQTPDSLRADRLVNLGGELTRHGLYEMAEARFTEATTLVPGHTGAMLGLGELMLRQNRLAEAEPLFRSVLTSHPESAEAKLGIAAVHLGRGGDEVAKAQSIVQGVIETDPKQPKARFLMGLIHEQHGETGAAAAEFKRAAELLMNR